MIDQAAMLQLPGLPTAMRSNLSPSALGSHDPMARIRVNQPGLGQLMPKPPQLGGLGSLADFGRMMLGPSFSQEGYAGTRSLLGGL